MAAVPHALREFLFPAGMVTVLVTTLVCDRDDLAWIPFLLLPGHVGLMLWYRSPELRRRERRAKGLCLRCGYDLHGNVSGVCPECGTSVRYS
jgi:hypothetical protein